MLTRDLFEDVEDALATARPSRTTPTATTTPAAA